MRGLSLLGAFGEFSDSINVLIDSIAHEGSLVFIEMSPVVSIAHVIDKRSGLLSSCAELVEKLPQAALALALVFC